MSWDTGNTDFSSGNAQFDFSSGTAQMDFSSGNAGFASGTADFSSGGGQADFSNGQVDFSSGGQNDFSGGQNDFSGGQNDYGGLTTGDRPPQGDRPPRPEMSAEDTLKFKNYKWASNRTRYEFNENAVDEYGMAPRDEELEKELFGETQGHAGLDFSRYENIPVIVERGQAPPRIKSFDEANLHPVMKENVKLANYSVPTPVQTIAIPVVTSGKDMMACAQTGSGKTAAFLVPTLSALFQNASEVQKPRPAPHELRTYKAEPLILIIAPTRELCSQIFDDCRRFTYRSCLRPCAVYGGADTVGQLRQLERGCDILAASPGRLIDFIQRGKIALNRVKYLILDEADRMLDMGFEAVIRAIIQKNSMNTERQTLLFSATFPRTIRALARDFLKPDYLFVKVGRVGGIPNSLTQKFIEVEETEKRDKLEEMLKSQPPTRILIFVETKRSADSLDQFLYERAFPSTSIHGDRSQMEREDALLAFKRGVCPILVATAVAARGIDIPNVMHVVNYDMPKDMDEYIHRIGRTARQGKTGLATSFYNSGSDMIATELYKLLKECNQEIPDCLKHYETDDITFDEDLDDTGVEQPSYAGQEFIAPEKYVPGGGGAAGGGESVDWDCPSCNVSNFGSRQVCFKCQTPKSGGGGDSGGYGASSGDYGNSYGSGGYGNSGGGRSGGKPGDWDCPDCGVSNFGTRQACFKCSAAKPEGAGGDSGGYGGGGGRSGGKPGDWDCPDCGVSNFGTRQMCFKCSTPKPEGAGGDSGGYGGGRSGGKPGDWDCPDCSQSNFATRGECFKCGTARPAHLGPPARREPRARREGDWDCPSCSAVNYSNRTDCFKCHSPKEGGGDTGDYGSTSYGDYGQDSGAADTSAGAGSWDPNGAAAAWSGGANNDTATTTTTGGWNAPSANATTGGGDWNASSTNATTATTGGGGDWNAPSANTSAPATGGWNQTTTTAPPVTQAPVTQAPAVQSTGGGWSAPTTQTGGGGWNQEPAAVVPVTQPPVTQPAVTQPPVAQASGGGWNVPASQTARGWNQPTSTAPPAAQAPIAQQSSGGWNQTTTTAPPATQAPVTQQSGGGWNQQANNVPDAAQGGGWNAPAPVKQAPPVQQQAPPVQQQQQAPAAANDGGWSASANVSAGGWGSAPANNTTAGW